MQGSRLSFIIAATFAVAGVAAVFGCRGSGMDTAAEMKADIDKDIPIGMAANTAASRLRSRGFSVVSCTDASWVDRTHANFLYGNFSEGLFVQRRWQVAVFNNNGVVTGTDVTTSLTGP